MLLEEQQIRPGDMDPGEFRQIGREVIDAIADYHAGLAHRSVLPQVTPEEVAARFAGELAERGESAAALLANWRDGAVARGKSPDIEELSCSNESCSLPMEVSAI